MDKIENVARVIMIGVTCERSMRLLKIADKILRSVEGYERLKAAGAPDADALRWQNRRLAESFVSLNDEIPPWQIDDATATRSTPR